jgi:hypothetical protein
MLCKQIWAAYVGLGSPFTMVSMYSCTIYYSVGPGALWNVGLFHSSVGWLIGMLSAALRMVTWAMLILVWYQQGWEEFWRALFYVWYH